VMKTEFWRENYKKCVQRHDESRKRARATQKV
jgi:hypothetical protein